ncbi:phosphonate C-P lyase system protein PhnG [Mesorhizobium sp. CAU 1741]|uniref:phosphonate C-P lyase system protein PhnG n=1 Tax=Mesorhizobium sp. CAU 1741 TaxID=3140366 RepID=UPI00325BFE93
MRQADRSGLNAQRKAAMAVMAHAPAAELARLWAAAEPDITSETVRGPETGLVMVRGRIGGGGDAFNLGEATVTRATVRLGTGEIGHSYALGRDGDKAVLAATIDAVLQRPGDAAEIEARVLAPLRVALDEARERQRAETAATKVEFFTMVRGED